MLQLDALLKPLQIGKATMANRFVMAPLTRCRATDDHVPTDAMVKYYSDRASFGLIVSEATMIQDGYSAFGFEAGIYNLAQVEAWRKVTDAVHAKGGLIYCQLHHGGRATVQCNLTKGGAPVSAGTTGIVHHKCPPGFARDGKEQSFPEHVHALSVGEIASYVKLFAAAAKNAMAAGFDGVEVHAAGGFLLDSFLRDSANKRLDKYGGSLENRSRFLLETLDAVIAAVGKEHVSVRISPLNSVNDMADSNPEAFTRYVCGELSKRKIAFLDIIPCDYFSPASGADKWARESFDGVLFTSVGYDVPAAEKALQNKVADAVMFGRSAISNPDFVARATTGAELNALDMSTFYTRDEKGYNDYPVLVAAAAAQ